MIHRASAIALFLVVISTAAFAGSYILPSDEELVRRADAIGTFTVTSANSYYGADGLIYTRYSLSTGERIKGELATASTYVTEMGGVVGSRMFSVSTSPAYAPGERVLVFLARRGETWTTLDGQMGKFSFARGADGSEILVRDQDAFAIFTHGTDDRALESPATAMLERIRRLAAESRDEPVRQLAISPMLVQPDDAGANTAFNTARGTWNGDAGSNINIANGGTATALNYGNGNDDSVIHFGVSPSYCYGDPVRCPLNGSVVGQAQLWATNATNTLRGEEFYTADECDIIVEAGLTGTLLNEVAAHELGHCLGFRHSNQGTPSSTSALMNSSVSGVSANLRSWDRDAANAVYGDGTAAPGVTGNSYLQQFGSPLNGGARWPSAGFSMKVHGDAALVCSAPAIATQPADRTIFSGQTARLSVSATGTMLSHQWYSGGSPSTGTAIPGATSASFTTPALTTTQTYSVRVSNECGSVDSSVATVTVETCTHPAITTSPLSTTIQSGQSANLGVTATGSFPRTIQWYRGISGNTSNPIPGATSATLNTGALTATSQFWVRIANGCGTADSATATVTVQAACTPPVITTQPQGASILTGAQATLQIVATGAGPLVYQWYTGSSGDTSSPIGGASGATLATGPITRSIEVWVRVTSPCGTADSESVRISVKRARAARRG